jgi:hypothetical protein
MRSNDSDVQRNTKKRKKSRRSTRRSPRLLEKEKVASGIWVLLQTDLLPWRDAMALGSTCRTAQDTWMMTRDVHMLPLLNVLEKMLGHDEDEDDEDKASLRDILLDKNYDNFSISGKCKDLAINIGFMVINMRSHRHFCLDDPSNRLENMECDPVARGWEMGWGNETETDYWHEFHRRGTLALNIAIFDFAFRTLNQGEDIEYFTGVFMGMDNAYLGGGSCYGHTICYNVASMFPFRDKDLVKHMRKLYPSATVLELLGPALTKRVVLAEPFFRFLPPSSARDVVDLNSTSDSNEEDGHVAPLFENLPTPLEPLTEEIIIENGMGAWLDPNHTRRFLSKM